MKNIQKDVVEIVNSSSVAFLSTINLESFPETRAMSNILNRSIDDNLEIYFDCHTDSPKVEQIKRNNNASLYYFMSENMKNMTLFGKFELISDRSLKDRLWKDEFTKYYRNGKEDALYGVLKFIPVGYKCYIYGSTGIPEKVEGKF